MSARPEALRAAARALRFSQSVPPANIKTPPKMPNAGAAKAVVLK